MGSVDLIYGLSNSQDEITNNRIVRKNREKTVYRLDNLVPDLFEKI